MEKYGAKFLNVFGGISLLLMILSLISFAYVITENWSVSATEHIFYMAFIDVKELMLFSFAAFAFYISVKRNRLMATANENNRQNIERLISKDEKDEINRINYRTIALAQEYMREIQLAYRDLVHLPVIPVLKPNQMWDKLSDYTQLELLANYKSEFQFISDSMHSNKKMVLPILYNLEAYSCIANSDQIDQKLLFDLVGYVYIKQVEFILGLISYFRDDAGSFFCKNTLALYNQYKLLEQESTFSAPQP